MPTGRTLFHLFGIPWQLTSSAWLFVPSRLALGLLIGLVTLPELEPAGRLGYGLIFGLLTLLSQFAHIIGHTLGGLYVGAAMTANLVLGTRILTFYGDDPASLPARVHVLRTMGGPLANLAICMAAAVGWSLKPHPVFAFAAGINLALSAITLLPLPGLDGEVLWRLLRQRATVR